MRQGYKAKIIYVFIGLLIIIYLVIPLLALAETFSIVVLPDTQFYSESNPSVYQAQTQWIVDNAVTENIIYVIHLGDIVDSPTCTAAAIEWGNADTAMDLLDTTNIPYGVLPGNHDWDAGCVPGPRENYNTWFGPDRFTGLGANYGTYDGETNDNNYVLFSSPEGVDFIAINLAYSAAASGTETDILEWADARLKEFPDRNG